MPAVGHRGMAGSSTRDHSPRLPPPASEVLSLSTSARPPLLLQGPAAPPAGDRRGRGGRASTAGDPHHDRAASGDHAPPCERARRQRTKSSAPSTARRSAPRRSLPTLAAARDAKVAWLPPRVTPTGTHVHVARWCVCVCDISLRGRLSPCMGFANRSVPRQLGELLK